MGKPLLIVVSGLPGVGKTTVSRELAACLPGFYLRLDEIETALRSATRVAVGASGYVVANALAASNLAIGHCVVADCVNPVEESRAGWRQTAMRSGSNLVDVELICSDLAMHRRRVETRAPDIPDQRLPTWQSVQAHHYEPWTSDRLVIDTALIEPNEAVRRIKLEATRLSHGPQRE